MDDEEFDGLDMGRIQGYELRERLGKKVITKIYVISEDGERAFILSPTCSCFNGDECICMNEITEE